MDPIVSVSWLAAHLAEPDVIALDATLPPIGVQPVVDVQAQYRERHIPGAVFFDIEALSDKATALPHMLPDEETFGESMSALGLSNAVTVVVYERDGVFSAPRAWWMLRTMGASNVCVLDGGLQAWIEAGYEMQSGQVTPRRGMFEAHLQLGAVRNFAEVQAILKDKTGGAQVLDARSAGRFTGAAPEPRAGLRSGHMPGALNVTYTELVRNGALKTREELQEVFTAREVNLSLPIVTTCGSGVTAAVLALGLERCGAPQVSVYDGSWAEYAQQPGATIVTG